MGIFPGTATIHATFVRYLVVGAANTIVGYGLFALFTFLLTPLIPLGYIAALVISNLISVTFAFFAYKWFVFKTQGNYWREWIRCVGVYSVGLIISIFALPLIVAVVQRQTGNATSAPYIGGALLLGVSVIFGFFGHRHISFSRPKQAA